MYDAKEYPIRIQVKPSSEEFHAQIQDKQKDENAKEQKIWKWAGRLLIPFAAIGIILIRKIGLEIVWTVWMLLIIFARIIYPCFSTESLEVDFMRAEELEIYFEMFPIQRWYISGNTLYFSNIKGSWWCTFWEKAIDEEKQIVILKHKVRIHELNEKYFADIIIRNVCSRK